MIRSITAGICKHACSNACWPHVTALDLDCFFVGWVLGARCDGVDDDYDADYDDDAIDGGPFSKDRL